ncbi:LacI family DNA-binding transcriptional regulator [Salinibacter ruber]|jgi:LacI family transcriptional regulator|uniref:LacI family transcriptional regulator n=1 Tax=Salinibacter ruber TaxID=146919 RepID=A0A9X2PWW5_9BACT|nr:LacI family DNA-binding transcriptional regulator [Salinibacter ruber]MCS3629676.1 LacI family transcriptional regulator [Salinibacter ruber]MCS3651533.1 LacI family transcriptional regulator [Salinibacter ruber]MCS3654539.1 LacI family transcriptional regulator [Salinibacter ruber]MCS3655770.1 LacI family transcriptional regulator [Salinibacter ruber]MCS3703242.1 LacI family transcriptional regulator [Salinibacter ruber]
MPNDAKENSNQSKATIYDVADHAGVAISTVSRVLNDSEDVADQTRDKVVRAIQELQFRPNRTAKSLAQRSTRTIAVALPTFTTPFHNELLKGVRDRLDDEDVDLLLCDLEWEAPKHSLRSFLEGGAMDGLLLVGVTPDEDLADELRMLGGPVVLVGAELAGFDSFYWEDQPGAELAVNHLIDQDYTRIGAITTPHDNRVRNERIAGYRQALEDAGIEFNSDLVVHGHTSKHDGFSEESGYEAMQDLLALDDPVEAAFASSDVQAIGAWQALREEGFEVPDDFAFVGYDDIKVSRFIGLSSVAQNMHNVGNEGTDLLLDRLEKRGPENYTSRLVEPELHIRKSSQRP